MIINICSGFELFRYDIDNPPENWDAKHKNTEYIDDKLGAKNKGDFFFLYDNENIAHNIAKIACNKNKDKTKYWITNTKTLGKLSILDFGQCKCIHEMLDLLDSSNINVCNPDMKINGMKDNNTKDRDFGEFLNHHYFTRINPRIPNLIENSWFGQLLTDFNNGPLFKWLVMKSGYEIDGYRWFEDLTGLTYCLFESIKLNEPKKKEILF